MLPVSELKRDGVFCLQRGKKTSRLITIMLFDVSYLIYNELNYLKMSYRFEKITLFHCMNFRYHVT